MSIGGCPSGFTVPTTGFHCGFMVYKWDGLNWAQVGGAGGCTDDCVPPGPPHGAGTFVGECRVLACQLPLEGDILTAYVAPR